MNDQWITDHAKTYFQKTIIHRRQLHQHPELSFHEENTAAYLEAELAKMPGMRVKTGIGLETAVIATIRGGDGPTIGVRADMDALPISEANQCLYRSQNEGVMHACGHDAHMAIALSVAHLMSERWQRGELTGTVRFLFQPAEETTDRSGKTGGYYLAASGVLDSLDALFALHVMPEYPLGVVLVPDGYCTANVDEFTAIIKGKGGHGAYPHLSNDPIWMLGSVLQALQGIVSRETSPLEPAVVSVCHVAAGDGKTNNVIPSEARLQGTFRSYSPEVRAQLVQQFESVLSIVKPLGGDYQLLINHGEPSVYNHQSLTPIMKRAIGRLLPEVCIRPDTFGLGGEDFAHMAARVPSAMFFLGCATEDGVKRDLHAPIFDLNENSLLIGVTAFAGTILECLHHPEQMPDKKQTTC
ncbi:M20 metallopeptidase family protein [Sporolactobacillus terrae]|uniref:Amidohydrolase n=1 Tax=Sporolactobacillus terrae TaxID=269673 RepID=A0ABX5Q4W5_9BACL|nr:amidohydrolase [Sporolactobacillus terrae]QAA21686.1 amidohydrolase [Sporolactobacillus terrae]QAA24658.1 amidohydrolase [Sporolactobacillus terrae]